MGFATWSEAVTAARDRAGWRRQVFLQETYSSPDVEKLWKTQWKGDLYFAHGSERSRGVLILVKERLNFELKSCTLDK